VVDRAEPPLEIRLGGVEDVHEQKGTLEVCEELVPEAGAFRGAFDQARDVGDRQLAVLRPVDHAEDRLERRERIVRDSRLRVRDPAEQRRFARVREARKSRVDHELQLELDVELVAR
jgi:hypothetical protein